MKTSKKRNKKKIFLFSLAILILFFAGVQTYKRYVHKGYAAKETNKQEQQCQKCEKVSNAKKMDPETPIYFTLSDPAKRGGDKGGMRMQMDGYEKSKIPSKKVWLVFGDNNLVSNLDLETFVFDTAQKQKNVKADNKMGVATYSFEVPKSGYYNLIAKNETIDGNTLFYRVAKLEYLNGKHGSKDIYNDNVKKELKTDKTKIDLIRLKDKNENSFLYTISMGETLKFKAMLDGKPLKNADLIIDLESGWSKHIKTDENGIASFTIIRDYFPFWDKFDKRFKQDMLITLQYNEENNGTMGDQKYKSINYILTYPLSYYPNGIDYLSYGFGLIIGIFVFTLSGIIIYIYRRNRTKPFREIRYEE
ncbi:MAG: hypothetical protein PHE73_01415 [Sulfurovaceae bacterium]|nr:hypothetical protein [Sulfurovaceae bacterium]